MKKHLAALASVVALVCAPGFALGADAPMAPADPAVVAATKQLFEAMKLRDTMVTSLQLAEQQMPAQMRAATLAVINNNPKLSAEQKAAAIKRADQVLPGIASHFHTLFADPAVIDEMLAEIVPLYAQTYTLDEIHQLSAFYASPVGQKTIASTPRLIGQTMQISQRIMMPRIQKLMADTANSLAADASK